MPAPRPSVPAALLAVSSSVALALAGCAAPAAVPDAPLAAAGAPAPAARFEVAGRAVLFGEPLAGATVKIFAIDGAAPLATGTTDATGAFVLALGAIPAAGAVRMVAGGVGNMVAGGAGNMVAGGAGNMVAGGAGNMVAGGAGNMVAGGAGNMVAGGAGNMVAGGAGNMVAGGAGNMVSGGAGNMVAGGAGNMVAGGAGNFAGGPVLASIGSTAALVRPAGYRALLAEGGSTLDEVTTASYVAIAPKLAALGKVTEAEARAILAGFEAVSGALAKLDPEARRALIGDEILQGVDATGLRPAEAGPLSPAVMEALNAVPGFADAFEAVVAAVEAAVASPDAPPGGDAPAGDAPADAPADGGPVAAPGGPALPAGPGDAAIVWDGGSGGSGGASVDAPEPASLTVRVDLPGGPTLAPFAILSLRTPGATVKIAVAGPSHATTTVPVGLADPLEVSFTGLEPGDGYSLVAEGLGAGGVPLARATRVLALGPDGLARRDAHGRVLDLATFSLNEGANAASVLLPLGGPSTKVTP